MGKKLTWDEIIKQYYGEWVELVDYEWDETEPDPKAGVVRIHSKNRKEFEGLVRTAPPEDSALVFVGKIVVPEGMTISSNLNQFMKQQ
ncbi:MAG: hypothetical protein IT291_06885 [Deltaproteobacteria bacterium]|nr:hypothetical protein [Deltaproteobacteria bacterium]